jgi:hypothetical protein
VEVVGRLKRVTSTLQTGMALQPTDGDAAVVEHEDGGGGLADVVNTVLDKGLVVDVFARVAVVGIEVLRVDARVVVAGVDTYLRFAEAAGRLGVGRCEPAGLPGLVEDIQSSSSTGEVQDVLETAGEEIETVRGPDEEHEPRAYALAAGRAGGDER